MKVPLNDILSRDKVLRKPEYYHALLVKGSDFSDAKKKVLNFFEQYQLVRYSRIEILEKDSSDAGRPGFNDELNTAIEQNREIVRTLVQELQDEGITAVDQLGGMPQGYQSKMLHVLTHFLDGFFGIDTYFYNLEEDSHWVSDKLRDSIKENPSYFWLLFLRASIL
jgi:hypothetical protein